MLWAEQGDNMNAGYAFEEFEVAAALRVQAGVIGDEADVLTAQGRKFLDFQDVEAGLDAARASAFRSRAGQRAECG
jgi:hypothetical protein